MWLTGTWPLMMTSSAKRTLTGLVFNLAFLAALMNADLGDFWREMGEEKSRELKDNHLVFRWVMHFFFFIHTVQGHDHSGKKKHDTPYFSTPLSADAINRGSKWGRQREDAPNSGAASRLQSNYWQKEALQGVLWADWSSEHCEILQFSLWIQPFFFFFFYPQFDSLSGSFIKTKHSSCWASETLGEKKIKWKH